MQLEQHRARRYSFHASVELTDLQSETQTKEQTSDSKPSRMPCGHAETFTAGDKGQDKDLPQK